MQNPQFPQRPDQQMQPPSMSGMVEVFFYTKSNPNRVFFSKHMISPPRIGEKMGVLTNPMDDRSIIDYAVDDIITLVASFETGKPETKMVFLREINPVDVTIDQNRQAR